MPRNYVRKRETKYTLEDLQNAVKDVKEKKKTYRQAEEEYKVPISVIYHRLKGRKIDINKMGAGVPKVLPNKIEEYLACCLKTRAQMGFPVSKEELKRLVQEYVEKNQIKTPFKNKKPGDDWYVNFMKRHPDLTFKKAEHLQKSRQSARKPCIIYDFYSAIQDIVDKNDLHDKSMYVFNCDESGFQSDPSKLRAIGPKGKPLYRVSGGSGRESTTVLACVSADGHVLPPVIVYKGAAVQARWTSDKSFPGTLYAATKNGWMEEPVFFNWMIKSFIPYVDTIRQERNEPTHPALLFYDGHASHISLRIIEAADKANIILAKFPSHLTDKIQPLDKCVFGPVKKAWDKKLVEHGIKQMGKGTGRLSRAEFAELLGEVYAVAFKPQNIISGFVTTGLFPVDPTKFPKALFDPKDLELYNYLLANETIDAQQGQTSPATQHQLGTLPTDIHVTAEDIDREMQQEEIERMDCYMGEDKELHQVIQQGETERLDYFTTAEETEETLQEKNNTDDYKKEQTNVIRQIDKKNTQQLSPIDVLGKCQRQHTDLQTHNINSGPSSSLVNNIMKLISMDAQTDNTTKQKMLSALCLGITSTKNKETESPNKEALENIFGIKSVATPEKNNKNKKIVIPRLKQAVFGEILTSDEVKERLKEAEQKKTNKNRKGNKQKQATDILSELTNKQKKEKGKKTKLINKLKKKTKTTNKLKSDNSSDSDITMSIHSDSDIAEVQDEYGISDEEMETMLLTSREPEEPITLITNEPEPSTSYCRSEENIPPLEFNPNDTVLVRYLLKKRVQYFVGTVLNKVKNDVYEICFFKRSGKSDSTRFKTSTKDIDKVPLYMIVKKVNLLAINDKENEFILFDEEDSVYFDY